MTTNGLKRPVIVGVGQVCRREKVDSRTHTALTMARDAVLACVDDAESREVLKQADSVTLVRSFSMIPEPSCRDLCDLLDVNPSVRELSPLGGNTPQWLINRAADRISTGEINIAVIAGGEAFYNNDDRKLGLAGWKMTPESLGDLRFGFSGHEACHGASKAQRFYPLFDNALRAERGLTPEEYRGFLADYLAAFSKKAQGNPNAWTRQARSAEEIGAVNGANRLICFPYTKLMNPNPYVNQGAAVIMTSTETAARLNIPRDKWVYPVAGAEAADKWFVSERVNYTSSPAIASVADYTLSMAGLEVDRINQFDLYSCFPCATLISAREWGRPAGPDNPPTITGGLPYFGGPGNNFAMHSAAEAVTGIRRDREQYICVTGLGWYLTKHAAGIYSGVEPERPWTRPGHEALQEKLDAMESPELEMRPSGTARVETYTIIHDREGLPELGIVAARLEDGRRCWANTEKDVDLMEAMEKDEFIGRTGRISHNGGWAQYHPVLINPHVGQGRRNEQ